MAKRWTIPFVSQANKQCRIDIYDPGYTGSVTELSTNNANAPGVPAADPFYFEEDDDQDLLNVVRIKTGYINLIETVQDGLVDIYPTTLKSRYVEVYYNYEVCFRGYIQQQSFENEWKGAPREISLPVISVLGVAESMEFTPDLPFVDKCIGYYMKRVLEAVEPVTSTVVTRFNRVVFPQNDNGNSFAGDFAASIRPLVTTTNSSEFSKTLGGYGNPYVGISMYDFLEGICNAYGWMLHDMATYVLFNKFDNTRAYAYYPVNYGGSNDIETATGKEVISDSENVLALDTYMEPSADDSSVTQIMPLRSITMQHEGEYQASVKCEFDHMRCRKLFTVTQDDEKFVLAFLDNGNPNFKDIESSNLLTKPTISDWKFTQDGVAVADFKGKKRIILQRPQNWQGSGNAFTLNLWERPLINPNNYVNGELKLEVDCSWGTSLLGIGNHDDLVYPCILDFTLYNGTTILSTKRAEFRNEGDHIQTVTFNGVNVPQYNALRIAVKAEIGTTIANSYLLSIDGIKLYYEDEIAKEYLVDNKDYRFVSDAGGFEEGNVNMLMSCQYISSHTIRNSFVSAVGSFFTTYQYLRNPQNRLQLRMRPKSGQSFPEASYLDKIQYWRNAWRWRIIALAFHPWDDEWQLTMHRSSTIE